jgi:hypothetical protein
MQWPMLPVQTPLPVPDSNRSEKELGEKKGARQDAPPYYTRMGGAESEGNIRSQNAHWTA